MTAPTSEAPGAPASTTDTGTTGGEGQAPDTTTEPTNTAATAAAQATGTTPPARKDENVRSVDRPEPADTTKPAATATSTGREDALGATDVEGLPDWARKVVLDARKGEGDYRIAAKTAEDQAKAEKKAREDLLTGIAKTLGLDDGKDGDDLTQLTPEKLAEIVATKDSELSAKDQKIAGLLVERAAEKAARRLGADGDRMTDSRSFTDQLSKLDMADAKFAEKLDALVKKTVEEHPEYKIPAARAAAAPSGGDFTGGPGGRKSPDDMSIEEHRAQHVATART